MTGGTRKRGATWSYYFDLGKIDGKRQKKLQKEKANIEAQHRKGSQVYPDFRLIMMARLEA